MMVSGPAVSITVAQAEQGFAFVEEVVLEELLQEQKQPIPSEVVCAGYPLPTSSLTRKDAKVAIRYICIYTVYVFLYACFFSYVLILII
mgnify:CR=1 FL=1